MSVSILVLTITATIGSYYLSKSCSDRVATGWSDRFDWEQGGRGRAREAIRLTCLVLLLSGCAAQDMTADLSPDNFLQFSTITQKDDKFFAPLNKSAFRSCIDERVLPDPRPERCHDRFAHGRELDMRRFIIKITDNGSAYAGTKAEELALLIAGKVGMDQGYPYVIKLAERQNGSCMSSPSVYSSGTLNGNYYSGYSTVMDNTACSSLYTVEVLLFKNYDDIRNGVVLGSQGANSSAWFFDLYYNMRDRYSDISSGDPGRIAYFEHHPLNPWKSYLPSRSIFETLATKYGVPRSITVPISRDSLVNTSKSVEDQLTIHANQP
jgi:hypothetical protein